MSMDEEYLDNLLKSVESGLSVPAKEPEAEETATEIADNENLAEEENAPEVVDIDDNMLDIGAMFADDTQNLSEEEISRLLEQSAASAVAESKDTDRDLSDLLSDGDESMDEISELLNKADQNEAVDEDVLSLLTNISDEAKESEEPFDLFSEMEEDTEKEDDEQDSPKEKKRRDKEAQKASREEAKRLKREQKEAAKQQKAQDRLSKKKKGTGEQTTETPGEKKAGFWHRLLEKWTEEEEEQQTAEVELLDINAENNAIMEELAAEDKKTAAQKKKGKNAKDKKKKGKAGEEGEEKGEKGKEKKKKAKTPKPKKEKKVKPVEEEVPGKKIGKKNMIAIVIFAGTILVAMILGNLILSPMLAKRQAKSSFEQRDYEACFRELAGLNLSESEQTMLAHAEVVLKMERRITAFEQYDALHMDLEALDSLMRAVENYDQIYQEALNCGAENEVEEEYALILGLLQEEYGITEADAKAIVACESNVDYTRCLTAVIQGENFADMIGSRQEIFDSQPGELLPEEQELPDVQFAE